MSNPLTCLVTDYGSTISADAIDHLIGQKPVDPAAAAALRALHDDLGMRIILASNTQPHETRWTTVSERQFSLQAGQPCGQFETCIGDRRTRSKGVNRCAWEHSRPEQDYEVSSGQAEPSRDCGYLSIAHCSHSRASDIARRKAGVWGGER